MDDKFRLLLKPLTLALLIAPVLTFVILHLTLEEFGYNPLPLLPIVALVGSFFYSYHVTNWLRKRK